MRRRCSICRQEVYVEEFDNTMDRCQKCSEKIEREQLEKEAL